MPDCRISGRSTELEQNRAAMKALVADASTESAGIEAGGGERTREFLLGGAKFFPSYRLDQLLALRTPCLR